MKNPIIKIIILNLLLLLGINSYSQYVTIPDTNFRNWLITNHPSIMVGGMLDTNATSGITMLNPVGIGIFNIDGIQYFDDLDTLQCSNNLLTSLPTLPNGLYHLDCYNNSLTSLPPLPSGMFNLNCSNNNISSLPLLPNSLVGLYCYRNNISVLPILSSTTLTGLNCSENVITSLPSLPLSLVSLACSDNLLSSLPSLPPLLVVLVCDNNNLTSIPSLPSGLEWLFCNNNDIFSLPSLSSNLAYLSCSENNLTSIPPLPSSLMFLSCNNNNISSLPTLSSSLTTLYCDHNNLASLPSLPSDFKYLTCSNNNIISLPILPSGMIDLICDSNLISSYSYFPDSIENLVLSYNNFTSIPNVPNNINFLYIENNPISCLPTLPYTDFIVKIAGTSITCVPNYPYSAYSLSGPNIMTMPLCDITSGCPYDTLIMGNTYLDNDFNCSIINDSTIYNIKVDLYDSLETYMTSHFSSNHPSRKGLFNFNVDNHEYIIRIDTTNSSFTSSCIYPGLDSNLTVASSTLADSVDFPLTCKPGYDVGISTIIRTSGMFFPGQNAIVNISAGDMAMFNGVSCNTSGLGGTLQISYSGLASYVSAAPGSLIPSISGSTLTYTISDFSTVNPNDFQIIMHTDTSASIGDLICFDATITPSAGDYNLTNQVLSYCFEVVNSYDPNIKEVYPTDQLAYPFNDWLNYTIHFQNTGSAPAINIRLADTLDTDLNIQSFQLLGYSHPVEVSIYNGIVSFYFNNINLIDSTTNEPFSKGYVSYRIKPIDTPPVGTEIKNKAYIYFDYNTPILTNTTNNVVSWVGLEEEFSIPFSVYPNPTTEAVNLNFGDIITSKKIELVNMLGQVIYSIETSNSLIQIPVINHTKGLYLIKVTQNGLCKSKRLIVH